MPLGRSSIILAFGICILVVFGGSIVSQLRGQEGFEKDTSPPLRRTPPERILDSDPPPRDETLPRRLLERGYERIEDPESRRNAKKLVDAIIAEMARLEVERGSVLPLFDLIDKLIGLRNPDLFAWGLTTSQMTDFLFGLEESKEPEHLFYQSIVIVALWDTPQWPTQWPGGPQHQRGAKVGRLIDALRKAWNLDPNEFPRYVLPPNYDDVKKRLLLMIDLRLSRIESDSAESEALKQLKIDIYRFPDLPDLPNSHGTTQLRDAEDASNHDDQNDGENEQNATDEESALPASGSSGEDSLLESASIDTEAIDTRISSELRPPLDAEQPETRTATGKSGPWEGVALLPMLATVATVLLVAVIGFKVLARIRRS